MQKEHNIKRANWGGIYMLGTILGALLSTLQGQLIDRLSLKLFTFGSVLVADPRGEKNYDQLF